MIGRRVCRTTILLSRTHSSLSRRFFSFIKGHPLPEEAQEDHQHQAPFKYLRNSLNGAELFLVGTCHVSSDSANSVKEMIRVIKPSAVALELCEGRARSIRSEGQVQVLSLTDFLKFPGSFGRKVFSHSIRSLTDIILKLFGIKYGEEFRVALEEGDKIGADLHYIDQNADVTWQEIKKNLSFLEIANFVTSFRQHASRYPALFEIDSEIDKIKNVEDLIANEKVRQEFSQLFEDHFPGAMKALLHDRNEFMIKQLRDIKGKIVAVVGAGHLEGMEKLWREAEP